MHPTTRVPMPPKPAPRDPTQIRKAARQRRSKETVDAILEAAAHILAARGFEGATTNAVAERAGVSIGSLYQYFPNKAALVRALNEQHTHEILEGLRARLREVRGAPLPEVVRAMVGGMVEAHRVNPRLHRVLVAEEDRVNARTETRRVEAEVAALLKAFLDERQDLRPLDTELGAFILVQTVEAITHGAVLDRPEVLGEALVEETCRLLLGYLEPRPGG